MKTLVYVSLIIGLVFGCGLEPDDDKSKSKDKQNSSQQNDRLNDPDSTQSPNSTTPGDTTGVPGWETDSEIAAAIASGKYKLWPSEPAVHDSTGPHGKVRTFLNPALAESQKKGNSTHPVGSIAIKELYESDGTTIKGYAAEIKLAAGSTANTWLWYEDFNSTPTTDIFGRNIGACVGCHSRGTDYVTTDL